MNRVEVERVALEAADRHGCHTVILYGSWARGDATPASDVDVLCARDDGPSFRDARLVDGVYLDAFVYPKSALEKIDAEMLRLLGGVVLRERDRIGTALLERVQALHARGPDPLTDDMRQVQVVWAHKTLERIRNEDVDGRYRRMHLLIQALEDYFTRRKRWFPGSKEGLPWLLQNDPPAHALFEAAYAANATHASLLELVRAVYGDIP
jgi:predicted nucleotidyltransferase